MIFEGAGNVPQTATLEGVGRVDGRQLRIAGSSRKLFEYLLEEMGTDIAKKLKAVLDDPLGIDFNKVRAISGDAKVTLRLTIQVEEYQP